MHGNGVFQPGTHGVAGKAFRIADDYTADVFAKGGFKGIRFRAGGTAAGRGVCFVRDKHQLFGDVGAGNTAFAFGLGYQVIHYLGHVGNVQAGYVETAVADFRSQHFGKRLHTAFGNFLGVFHYQRYSTHTHNHAVAAAVKRQGGFGNVGFRGGGAGG